MGYGQGRVPIPGEEDSRMSKDKGQKNAKKPAASTAKEKRNAKRDKAQAATLLSKSK